MHTCVTIVMRYTWAKIFWAHIFWVFAYIKVILCTEISLIDINVSLPHIMSFLLISSFKSLGACGGPERTDFEQFLLWEGLGSWKNWFWTVSTLGLCGGLGRTDFDQFLICEGVVVMKELILNSFYFGRVWCKCKTYMPLKKIRGVWTYGGVGASEGIWMYGAIKTLGMSRCSKHMGVSTQCPPSVKLTCH